MFGTGILSYFSFLRFLVMLNLVIFLLMFSFVMLPIIVATHASGNITYNQNDGERSLVCFNPEHKLKAEFTPKTKNKFVLLPVVLLVHLDCFAVCCLVLKIYWL